MPAPTPRQRRKVKNRDTILDAAEDLIVLKGIENISLRQIARAADYSPAALYRYFDSKVALLQGLLARGNEDLLETLAAVPENLPPAERLVASCLVYIQYNLDHPAYPALFNTMPSGRKSRSQAIPSNSPFAFFLQVVGEWVQENRIPLDESYGLEEVTYALWALIHGMATLRLKQLRDFDADFETANRRTLEIYLKGLRS